MTEEEYLAQTRSFASKLKNTPVVGKRPFGYPKLSWTLSGLFGTLGIMAALPLVLTNDAKPSYLVLAIGGAVLFGCGFTMRHVAYLWGWHTAVDRHVLERISDLEREIHEIRAASSSQVG